MFPLTSIILARGKKKIARVKKQQFGIISKCHANTAEFFQSE